jgi:hypothetical protein
MTESADLDRMAKEVRAAAQECGAMILENILASESLPAVAVGGDAFPALVRHLRPRLIYMVLTKFDAQEEVLAHFEEEELDRDLKKLATKWKVKDGQSARLVLGLVADGVLHGIVEAADWVDEFDIEADELASFRQQEQDDAYARLKRAEAKDREAEEKKLLAPMVEKLLADPRFNAPKISVAKRLTLAGTLFPDQERATLRKAVDRAVDELWLAGSEK